MDKDFFWHSFSSGLLFFEIIQPEIQALKGYVAQPFTPLLVTSSAEAK